jgi:hypothetical protein
MPAESEGPFAVYLNRRGLGLEEIARCATLAEALSHCQNADDRLLAFKTGGAEDVVSRGAELAVWAALPRPPYARTVDGRVLCHWCGAPLADVTENGGHIEPRGSVSHGGWDETTGELRPAKTRNGLPVLAVRGQTVKRRLVTTRRGEHAELLGRPRRQAAARQRERGEPPAGMPSLTLTGAPWQVYFIECAACAPKNGDPSVSLVIGSLHRANGCANVVLA